jgi:26S proteasome regulatory subunit N12
MSMLLGLNLVYLLSQNRIAEFHTQLERLGCDQLESNVYIKYAVKLEQCLAEGAYNKVWKCRSEAPAEEYVLFLDHLMTTIRYGFH